MARAPRAAVEGLDPLTTIPIRRRVGRSILLLVAFAMYVPVFALAATHASLTWVASMLFWIGMVPNAWREVRARNEPADVVVDADRVVLRYPAALRAPLEIANEDVHSIVPLWLHPPAPRDWPLWRRIDAAIVSIGVRPTVHAPVLGAPMQRPSPVLALVLRADRLLPHARSRWSFPVPTPQRNAPVRALLVAVDDIEDAQRPFLPWGKLSRLTPEALERLSGG